MWRWRAVLPAKISRIWPTSFRAILEGSELGRSRAMLIPTLEPSGVPRLLMPAWGHQRATLKKVRPPATRDSLRQPTSMCHRRKMPAALVGRECQTSHKFCRDIGDEQAGRDITRQHTPGLGRGDKPLAVGRKTERSNQRCIRHVEARRSAPDSASRIRTIDDLGFR